MMQPKFATINKGRSMKSFLFASLFLISHWALASVAESIDSEKGCTLYRATSEATPISGSESIFSSKEVYGFSFQNLEIDFNSKSVSVEPIMHVVLGFNKNLLGKRVRLNPKNPQFNFMINQLNRRILLLETICVNSKSEVVYVKEFSN